MERRVFKVHLVQVVLGFKDQLGHKVLVARLQHRDYQVSKAHRVREDSKVS